MNDSSQNNEEYQELPGSESSSESSREHEDVFADITGDGIFTIKISEDMVIRNMLRSGLVDAQGKDMDKIPLFVSWPNWLDDGIVCLFAKDLHEVLHKAVKDMVISLNKILGMEELNIESEVPAEEKDYEVETVPEIESETAEEDTVEAEQEAGQNETETAEEDTVEAEQEADQNETETIPEQETSEDMEQVNNAPVENEENPEEPGKIAPGQDVADQLLEEDKIENNE